MQQVKQVQNIYYRNIIRRRNQILSNRRHKDLLLLPRQHLGQKVNGLSLLLEKNTFIFNWKFFCGNPGKYPIGSDCSGKLRAKMKKGSFRTYDRMKYHVICERAPT